jgi:hypothetical protein
MSKCACGRAKIDGLCPHGCEAFKKRPAARVQRAPGRDLLTAAEVDAAVKRVLPPLSRWTGVVSAKRVADMRRGR